MDKENENKDDEQEKEWKFNFVEQLNQNSFEGTLQGIEHALVMFYTPCKFLRTTYFYRRTLCNR